MPLLPPDLGGPSASLAVTTVLPALTVTSLSAPGSPTGLVAVPGDARVSLTWSAPLSTGGAKISDYVIEHSADAGTTWTRVVDPVSATASATVTGLTNGTSYLFRVAAVNAAGTGAPSAASAAVAPRRLPGAPTGLVGVPGDQRISLSWNTPLSDGGAAITDYVVRMSRDAGATWTTVTDGVSPATSATVTGLTNGTTYVFRVAAVNAAGTGAPADDSPAIMPATFGGWYAFSTPTQMVTGSAAMISGRVADPTGDRVDAIHLYRDLNGNDVLDLGIDELLHADTTPADGYAFNAGSLPSGRHVLHVAAMKDGAVVGSSTTTLAAARWWSVAIGSRIHGEARFETTGELVADPAPIELAPGPDGGNWQDAVGRRVTGTVQTRNLHTQELYDYAFSSTGGAYAIGTARELRAAFGPQHGIPVAPGTKLIVLEDLTSATKNDRDYDDQYWVVTMTPVLVDLDVDSDNTGALDRSTHEDDIEASTGLPGVIVPVGGGRVKMIASVPAGRTATLAIGQGADKVRVYGQETGGHPLPSPEQSSIKVAGGPSQTFWIEATAPSVRLADIAFTLTLDVGTGSGSTGSPPSDTIRATAVKVDLDVDSDNDSEIDPDNGKDGKDDPLEDRADLPGKRIFLNIDDDNQNGLPDHIDSHSAYVAKAADDDFAEMRLKVAATALGPLEGFTVRLRYPAAHIRLHATREKLGLVRDLTDDTDDGSRPYTLPTTGNGFYAWQLEPNVRLPDAVYAEGVTTDRSQVTLELVSPGGDVVKSDAVNLRVENIRLPNAGNQATDWHKENTDTWAGLKLEPGWWIDRSLETIINAPDDRHAIEIRTRYAEGKTADGGGFAVYGKEPWEGEGTPSKSVSTYANGFTLNFDFMFDPGYVQADDSKDGKPGNDNHKLSFFPNSGIKIWGLYEIAIFDSRKVATLAGLVVDGDGKLAATGYDPPEHATTLMTGVAYGVTADARMTDLKNNGGGLYDPIATLIAAAGRLKVDWMAMEITFTPCAHTTTTPCPDG